ncbi:GNAT family N-acetyltransferase [Vibrio rumoiensis]|uniref:GNAT family N-acetyltransferase n=1 Tax=Vibrio rumoiensis 1S-45 TaxID=1188252 RepID=A0A1E5E6S6_9VIBR|nr:GNAT family N-acetyltransferase [Vibrio rumoiensis]OEF30213.1 GNAT family N-acetyltransferase [Vibrio rumoiensis 1S-45]
MPHVSVRHSETRDIEAIKAIYECPNAYSGTLQLPNPSLKMWQERLQNVPANVYTYVAEVDGKVVGNLGVELCVNPRRRHVAYFGMGVHDDFQGQGVGGALLSTMIDLCDSWLNIKRIELTVYVDNDSAIALYKKFGFQIEGELQNYAFRNGEYVNAYQMARLNRTNI